MTFSVPSSPTVSVDPSAASTSYSVAPAEPGQRQRRRDLPVAEVVQRDDRDAVDVAAVREHRPGVRPGVEDLARAPGQLGARAVGLDEAGGRTTAASRGRATGRATLTCSAANAPSGERLRERRRVGRGEAAVRLGRPLHRRAHGQPALERRGSRPCRSPRRRTAPACRAGRTAGCRPSGSGAGRRRASAAAAGAARGRRAACPSPGRTRRTPPGARPR